MIRFLTTRRRLLRKGVYKYNRVRTRQQQFVRENKNLVKAHQNPKKEISAAKRRKLRPKREVDEGFKMAYRYRYYNNFNLFFIVNIYNNACEFIIFFSKVFE